MIRFGVDVPINGEYADALTLAELAADAEHAGWDGFFLQDVLFSREPMVDPWIALAAVALRTERIKIGVMLAPLPRYRPWMLARVAATLDHLSQGRLIFGAGLGFQSLDFTPFGDEYDARIRAEQLDEALEIVRGLWTGEALNFHGSHYQLDDVTQRLTPLQSPRIPVWLASGWPKRKPLRRAARWDGVYLMTFHQVRQTFLTPEDVGEAVAYLQAQREDTRPFDVAINVELPASAGEKGALLRRYTEAGATWWLDLAGETFAEYRERIRRGPPRGA